MNTTARFAAILMLTVLLCSYRPCGAAELTNAVPATAAQYLEYRDKLIADHTRPVYHLISPQAGGHIADPNFAFFWKGKYHLFFIAPKGFAHVSGVDMVHWRWHPITLAGGLSGTMFLNKDGVPTIIRPTMLQFALDDDLEKWSDPVPIQPVVKPGQPGNLITRWDPDAWTEGGATYAIFGVYPLGVGKEATLMKSTDLKTWEYLGPFMTREMPDVMRNTEEARKNEDISCPNFFPIGNKRMLLCISHIRGCRYYIGEWKNERFVPEFHGRMNWPSPDGVHEGGHGGEFFAPESLLAPDGRRVMWAWIFAQCGKNVGKTWHESMSLPRELSLPEDGVLRIKPLRELEQLRFNPACEKNLVVENGTPYRLKEISGDTLEIMVDIQPGGAKSCGLRVLCDKDNGKGLDIVIEPENKCLKVGSTTAPLELKPGEEIKLRVFIDRSIVEVFVNDRQAVVKQHVYAQGDVGVCLIGSDGKVQAREVKGWQMAAANPCY